MSDTKPMTLVTSNWNGQTTFRLIPISLEAAFSEGIYDPLDKVLVLMSKHVKESVHLIPRLDDNGDPVPLKKPRSNGKNYKEQRITLQTYTEYYVTEKDEIKEIVTKLADNASSFPLKQFLDKKEKPVAKGGDLDVDKQ